MAMARSFPGMLQKALRRLEVGADGLDPDHRTARKDRGPN